MTEIFIKLISEKLNLSQNKVKNTVKLLSEGATVPFIARYRKEMTGQLNEINIGDIQLNLKAFQELEKRKETILKAIEEQGALTSTLKKKIQNCWDKNNLEDLYLPFKRKQKTKASIAIENGLEPLANLIASGQNVFITKEAAKYLNKKIKSVSLALEGARHILAERVSQNLEARTILRNNFIQHGKLVSKVIKKKKDEASKYESYFDFEEPLKTCPSHRYLAILRGEKEGFLRIKIEIDTTFPTKTISRQLVKNIYNECGKQYCLAIEDAMQRLLVPSIENESFKTFKVKADEEAIKVFSKNLKELLLAAPLGEKEILAIDPGFRTGCKLVALDSSGALLYKETIFPHPPQSKSEEAQERITSLVSKYNIKAVAVGNGTAGKETYHLLKNLDLPNTEIYFVNESGASIYSASAIAREEFPNEDITVRGAISIGRRLIDPLAELVKIDPKSIGVGQYQHDVDQKMLKQSLEQVVSSSVNAVGINVNTASKHLLTYVSGLGPTLAQNIVDYRTENGAFKERKELNKVARMGAKAFEQCVGFLRIKNGNNPLDNTGVHPESYTIVKNISKDLKVANEDLVTNKALLKNIVPQNYINNTVGLPTIQDIIKELEKPGLDPRGLAETVKFSSHINKIQDLNLGMILPGVVNNITKFGAFVDIGIKESGLVHISEIANKFIKDPSEVLSVNQKVNVKVIDIDATKKRVSLSIKQA